MRILMASHGYPPTLSGVTLVVRKVARAMVARGHSVTVITAGEQGEPYTDNDDGVQLVRTPSWANPFWKEGPIPHITQPDLQRILDRVQPDLVHSHEAAFLALQFLRLNDRARLPLIASCHYVPRFVAQYVGGNKTDHLVENLTWTYSIWLFNRCSHVVFATSAHRKLFVDQGLEVGTTIISNGVDTARYRPSDDQDERVEILHALPPAPRVLFVSRLAQDKKIDVLIRAMSCVTAELEAHLLIVGRGDDRERLENLAEELGLCRYVHFLGFVPEKDMPALYRAVDLFAIASTCEVQSLPTLQAVATGLPVVAVNAVALPELVRDELNGFLVSPEDVVAMAKAIVRILRDPKLAARLGEAGLAIAQAHAETHTFDSYEQLYRRLVHG